VSYSTNDPLFWPAFPQERGFLEIPFFYRYRGMCKKSGFTSTDYAQSSTSERSSNEGLLIHRRVPQCEIIDGGITRKELRGEVQVFATPERLWQVIITNHKIKSKDVENTDSRKLSYTNLASIPFGILGNKGKLKRVNLSRLQLGRELGWKQRRFSFPGLYERETFFQIVPLVGETGTTLIRTETFRGMLVAFLNRELREARRDIQLDMMELREKAENIS